MNRREYYMKNEITKKKKRIHQWNFVDEKTSKWEWIPIYLHICALFSFGSHEMSSAISKLYDDGFANEIFFGNFLIRFVGNDDDNNDDVTQNGRDEMNFTAVTPIINTIFLNIRLPCFRIETDTRLTLQSKHFPFFFFSLPFN